MASQLFKRQYSDSSYGDDDSYESWWFSSAGLAVRYAVVVILLACTLLFLAFSYLHARRRIRRGQAPLPYHRWLVSRRQYHTYGNGQPYYQQEPHGQSPAYGMQNYPPPPPAYNSWDAPPTYQPPAGGSKAMANQHIAPMSEEAGESSATAIATPAPAHPPPGRSLPEA